MHPFINLFGLNIPVYGILSALGIAASVAVLIPLCRRRKVEISDAAFVGIVSFIGVLIGSHLLYALTRAGDIAAAVSNYDTFESFGAFVKYVINEASGMVFYGGLYGGILAGALCVKIRKFPMGVLADLFAVVIPLFHAFGRVGCFFAGCCYGVQWQGGIGGRVIAKGAIEHTKRLPVQLIEAALLLVLFLALFVMYRKCVAKNNLMCVYLFSYAVLRFVLEYLRGDEIRGHLLWFSTSQWISILTIVGVLVYIVINKCKSKE